MFKQHYVPSDEIITTIYEKDVSSFNECLYGVDYQYIIFVVKSCENVITSFNIKSESTCVGFVCINGIIVSSFCVLKGNNNYPHLLLSYTNNVHIILDRICATYVNMISVHMSKCVFIKNYGLSNDNFDHRMIKVNGFGPSITYHRRGCKHPFRCTFDDYDNTYDIGTGYCTEIIDPVINVTKIREISTRIIRMLMFDHMVKDVALCIGIFMYYVV